MGKLFFFESLVCRRDSYKESRSYTDTDMDTNNDKDTESDTDTDMDTNNDKDT